MSRTVVAIPAPQKDLHSLYESLTAIREQIELLTGQRGNDTERAVTFQDLLDYQFLETSLSTDFRETPVVKPTVAKPYDLMIFLAGELDASEMAWRGEVLRAFKLQSDAHGSRASAAVAATGTPVLSIEQNGVEVLTVTFTGDTGAFSTGGELTFVEGDVITIIAPASPDATLADVSICLFGEKL